MDIENIWRQSSGSDDSLNNLIQRDDFSNLQSRLPLKKLKQNLLMSSLGINHNGRLHPAILLYSLLAGMPFTRDFNYF